MSELVPFVHMDRHVVLEYYKNHSVVECAERFGCCEETIKRRLLSWGVPLRSKKESLRLFMQSPRSQAWRDRKSQVQKEKYREHGQKIFSRKATPLPKKWMFPTGKRNGRWKGGISAGYWKQRVLGRYGEKCQICGWEEVPEILEVHHKDFDHRNNVIENGIVLCPICHRLIHYREKGFR